MVLANFFDITAIDAFCAELTSDLQKVLPPARCEMDSKQAQKGRDQAQGRVRGHVERLVANHRLNFYQKAKLGLRLLGALESAGYPVSFAKPFAYDVVAQVATAAAR